MHSSDKHSYRIQAASIRPCIRWYAANNDDVCNACSVRGSRRTPAAHPCTAPPPSCMVAHPRTPNPRLAPAALYVIMRYTVTPPTTGALAEMRQRVAGTRIRSERTREVPARRSRPGLLRRARRVAAQATSRYASQPLQPPGPPPRTSRRTRGNTREGGVPTRRMQPPATAATSRSSSNARVAHAQTGGRGTGADTGRVHGVPWEASRPRARARHMAVSVTAPNRRWPPPGRRRA